MAACELCNRDSLNTMRVCVRCVIRAKNDLARILELATIARDTSQVTMPSRSSDSGNSGKPGSRPPMNLATIDPENTTINTPTGPITILTTLEEWARAIRHTRQLTPYGIASLAATLHGQQPLTTLITFHQAHIDWALQDSPLHIHAYTHDLHNAHRALRHWDTNTTETQYRIACPADTDHGNCGKQLVLTQHDIANDTPTRCRAGHNWTARRLLAIANTETEIWLNATDLAHHLGVNETTIRRWAKAGHIRKQGDQYNWADARNHDNHLTGTQLPATM